VISSQFDDGEVSQVVLARDLVAECHTALRSSAQCSEVGIFEAKTEKGVGQSVWFLWY
jgi:hypothetical protein